MHSATRTICTCFVVIIVLLAVVFLFFGGNALRSHLTATNQARETLTKRLPESPPGSNQYSESRASVPIPTPKPPSDELMKRMGFTSTQIEQIREKAATTKKSLESNQEAKPKAGSGEKPRK